MKKYMMTGTEDFDKAFMGKITLWMKKNKIDNDAAVKIYAIALASFIPNPKHHFLRKCHNDNIR